MARQVWRSKRTFIFTTTLVHRFPAELRGIGNYGISILKDMTRFAPELGTLVAAPFAEGGAA
jgi:hypothetical protein